MAEHTVAGQKANTPADGDADAKALWKPLAVLRRRNVNTRERNGWLSPLNARAERVVTLAKTKGSKGGKTLGRMRQEVLS